MLLLQKVIKPITCLACAHISARVYEGRTGMLNRFDEPTEPGFFRLAFLVH